MLRSLTLLLTIFFLAQMCRKLKFIELTILSPRLRKETDKEIKNMKQSEIFNFEDKEVSTVIIDDEPHFNLNDCFEILEISNMKS